MHHLWSQDTNAVCLIICVGWVATKQHLHNQQMTLKLWHCANDMCYEVLV